MSGVAQGACGQRNEYGSICGIGGAYCPAHARWSVREYTIGCGETAQLCRECAAHPPEGIVVTPAGPDPHGGACDVCERDSHEVES